MDVFHPLRNVLLELHRCGVGESFRSLGKLLENPGTTGDVYVDLYVDL